MAVQISYLQFNKDVQLFINGEKCKDSITLVALKLGKDALLSGVLVKHWMTQINQQPDLLEDAVRFFKLGTLEGLQVFFVKFLYF